MFPNCPTPISPLKKYKYLGEFEAEFKKALGAQGALFEEKKPKVEISRHCPKTKTNIPSNNLTHFFVGMSL
jgi:hypothetical protein